MSRNSTRSLRNASISEKRCSPRRALALTRSNLDAARKLLEDYLPEALVRQNVEDVYVLLTDIQASESVVICCGTHAARILQDAFDAAPAADGSTLLPGVVSRKKQFIPKVMDAYQQL